MYVRKTLLKKYLRKIADKILKNTNLQNRIEREKSLDLERKLLGEKICLSLEYFEDEHCSYISLAAWQTSHWSFLLWTIFPASYLLPKRER